MSNLEKGLLDTSVVIDLNDLKNSSLPQQSSISSITLAELTAGPQAAKNPRERAKRQAILQKAERVFDPIPFDGNAAREYGIIYAAVLEAGQKARGAKAIDLLIACVAKSNNLPLFTRNPKDFKSLASIMDIVAI